MEAALNVLNQKFLWKICTSNAGSRDGKFLAGVGGAHIWATDLDRIFNKNLWFTTPEHSTLRCPSLRDKSNAKPPFYDGGGTIEFPDEGAGFMTNPLAEMSSADHALLLGHLKKSKPKKILEVGVSAGGTTKLLLEAMDRESCLHSVDINTRYYKDTSQHTGFIAKAAYSPSMHGRWFQYFGTDVAQCIESIGDGIDFVVLDTVHALPGEILSFLSILPYMAKNSVLFLHDISLHFKFKMENDFHVTGYQRAAYCNTLLFNAIYSNGKFNSRDVIPNSGVVLIDREVAMENIYQVLNVLSLDWLYIPDTVILDETRKVVSKFYTEYALGVYDLAILYNLNKN